MHMIFEYSYIGSCMIDNLLFNIENIIYYCAL